MLKQTNHPSDRAVGGQGRSVDGREKATKSRGEAGNGRLRAGRAYLAGMDEYDGGHGGKQAGGWRRPPISSAPRPKVAAPARPTVRASSGHSKPRYLLGSPEQVASVLPTRLRTLPRRQLPLAISRDGTSTQSSIAARPSAVWCRAVLDAQAANTFCACSARSVLALRPLISHSKIASETSSISSPARHSI